MTGIVSEHDGSWLYIYCEVNDKRYFVQRRVKLHLDSQTIVTYIDFDGSSFGSGIPMAGWDLTW